VLHCNTALFCVPCMLIIYREEIPNEPRLQESLAKDKGVYCEVESEGSLKAKVRS